MATVPKRSKAKAGRGLALATRVAGNKEGNEENSKSDGDGNKKGKVKGNKINAYGDKEGNGNGVKRG